MNGDPGSDPAAAPGNCPLSTRRRTALRCLVAGAATPSLTACADLPQTPRTPPPPAPRTDPGAPPRRWRMGFSHMPPRLRVQDVMEGIDLCTQRADVAVIHEDVPWAELLSGATPSAIVQSKWGKLVRLYRSRDLPLIFMADATDGIAREREAAALIKAGRSLSDPAIQRLHRSFVVAVARELKPAFFGLAAETNLVAAAAPTAVYRALVDVANSAARELRSIGYGGRLFTSVQVETAWGLLRPAKLPPGDFRPIDRHLSDFRFTEVIGLSSYPYFAFDDPARIPDDYYSRITARHKLPTLVVEGGWTSESGPSPLRHIQSTPQKQADYMRRHAQLLDSINALSVSQLLFADLDITRWPSETREAIRPFARIGLTDSFFLPKPALAAWDAQFSRPLAPA